MGSAWFLGIHFLLLASVSLSSTSVFQDHKSQNNHTNTHLNIYHSKPSLKDQLSHDQDRVKTLQSMLSDEQNPTKRTSSINIPLKPGMSIGSGNYYVKVGLGSPAKYYPMLMDTGSSLSWIQCQPCKVYCHSQQGPLFDPAASSSYARVPCAASECAATKRATLNDPFCTADKACVYTASYGDASFSVGYLSRDRLTLSASQSLPGFVYGCGQDNQGLFGLSAGILGLDKDRLSLAYQGAAKFGHGFSYCLPSSGGAGGFLSLGSPGLAGYKFTPMLTDRKNPSLYFIDLQGVSVGGKSLAGSAKVRTIIDSGTVITRLPRGLYDSLRDAVKGAVAGKLKAAPAFSILDACFKGTIKAAAKVVPEIRMRFGGGAELVVGAENALVEADKGVFCLAFAATDGVAIVGNSQQQRYRVVYDVVNSRIGFAPGGCS